MKNYILIFALFGFSFLQAQQLVYKPINPAFGGDTFNYQWLMSSASAQNQFDEKGKNGLNLRDLNSLDSFTDSLNRQILSELSRKLFGDQFGDGDLKPGTYIFGSIYLEVIQTGQGLLISILNTETGEQSQIVIPG
ncbi:curli assembly protein CsgF [Kaistella daneshvariae]|uniref:Curli production assembly/transport component CsgF n=1 Tax=Kaistella daneshvariae TaxID=2487074 RepID=A0ABM7CAJ0_9FLAO|nr:curli production assembly/transport component CsgF [Kaistella daneshvariae]AZI68039.1 curli assembly protein CsgF [Kaistella daneshvariae]